MGTVRTISSIDDTHIIWIILSGYIGNMKMDPSRSTATVRTYLPNPTYLSFHINADDWQSRMQASSTT